MNEDLTDGSAGPAPGSGTPQERVRIVIVDPSTAITGAFRGAVNIAQSVSPWADATLVLPAGSQIGAEHTSAFSEVVYVPMKQIRRSVRDVLLYLPNLILAGWRLRTILLRSGASARLVINDFYLMHGAMARVFGYKGTIATWVRIDPNRFPRVLAGIWMGAMFRASDHVIAVSDFIVGRLPSTDTVRRLYDPANPELGARETPLEHRQDIVCIANYVPGKGQDHALEAYALVAREYPKSRLLFYGGDMGREANRTFRSDLERRAADAGFGERVLFGEFAHDLAAVYEGAALALVLSEAESFSLSCLEACQFGLPVIAFRSGGPEEIIADEETGFLYDVGDIGGVADAISKLLRDPAWAERMGRKAAMLVRAKFSREGFERELKHLLMPTR